MYRNTSLFFFVTDLNGIKMKKKIMINAVVGLLAISVNAQNQTKKMTQNSNTFVNPEGLFDASKNGFSHIGLKSKESELIFISGQWASDEKGNLAVEDFEAQVKRTIENLKKALFAVNLSEKDLLKITVYIADYTPEKKMILLKTAGPLLKLEVYPTSVIVPVPVMATHPKSLIEIEAIATK